MSENIIIPEVFRVGDEVISESTYKDYKKHKVVRTTKTWAILDDGKKLPIDGPEYCREIWNYSNQHERHMYSFYRLPNEAVTNRAKGRAIAILKEKGLFDFVTIT